LEKPNVIVAKPQSSQLKTLRSSGAESCDSGSQPPKRAGRRTSFGPMPSRQSHDHRVEPTSPPTMELLSDL
jgi:hypothetical protein